MVFDDDRLADVISGARKPGDENVRIAVGRQATGRQSESQDAIVGSEEEASIVPGDTASAECRAELRLFVGVPIAVAVA